MPPSFTQGAVLIAQFSTLKWMNRLDYFLESTSLIKNMFLDYILVCLLLGLNNLSSYPSTAVSLLFSFLVLLEYINSQKLTLMNL